MIIYWIYINPFSDEKTYGIPKDQGIIIPYRGSPLGEIIHFVLPCNHNSPSHNTFRTASHPLPHPSIQLLPPRTPDTSRDPRSPASSRKDRMSPAGRRSLPARPSPLPHGTTGAATGHPAGLSLSPAVPW